MQVMQIILQWDQYHNEDQYVHNGDKSVISYYFEKRIICIKYYAFVFRCLQEVDAPDANGQTPLMLAALKIIG